MPIASLLHLFGPNRPPQPPSAQAGAARPRARQDAPAASTSLQPHEAPKRYPQAERALEDLAQLVEGRLDRPSVVRSSLRGAANYLKRALAWDQLTAAEQAVFFGLMTGFIAREQALPAQHAAPGHELDELLLRYFAVPPASLKQERAKATLQADYDLLADKEVGVRVELGEANRLRDVLEERIDSLAQQLALQSHESAAKQRELKNRLAHEREKNAFLEGRMALLHSFLAPIREPAAQSPLYDPASRGATPFERRRPQSAYDAPASRGPRERPGSWHAGPTSTPAAALGARWPIGTGAAGGASEHDDESGPVDADRSHSPSSGVSLSDLGQAAPSVHKQANRPMERAEDAITVLPRGTDLK